MHNSDFSYYYRFHAVINTIILPAAHNFLWDSNWRAILLKVTIEDFDERWVSVFPPINWMARVYSIDQS